MNTLKSVKSLVCDLLEAREAFDSELYLHDALDAQKAVILYHEGRYDILEKHLCHMDTDPREKVVLALIDDLSAEWVSENLGFTNRI